MLVDKAQLLGLSAPEMTALVGGMRVLGTNAKGDTNGVLTEKPQTLSNDFFVNLLDLDLTWEATSEEQEVFQSTNRKSGEKKWTATRADLIFGSNSQLRALSEEYACADSMPKFTADFIAAWTKVMNADRFDLR